MTKPVRSAVDLADGLFRAAHVMRHGTRKVFAPLGLTPAQERALRIVSRADAPVRMGELAERMGIVPRSATDLVDRLEQAGFVQRTMDPENRRTVLVTLAPAGVRLQSAMARARREAAEELFGPLDARQREQLGQLLDLLVAPVPQD